MGLDNLYRVLDANVNRTSEGLRVLEDLQDSVIMTDCFQRGLRN